MISQKDRILAQAQEEANRSLSLAREKNVSRVERDSIAQAARAHAKEIESKAHSDAERTRREADNYVIDTLSRIEYELVNLLNQARNGIVALQSYNSPEDPPETKKTEDSTLEKK
ncbi:MAG: hypothetical protein ABIG63_16095 [Chloroflexota bacterium]